MLIKHCTNPKTWNIFVDNSPQGNIFCKTEFLNALNVEYDLWFIKNNEQVQAGTIILRQNGKILIAPHPFTMYQGIMLTNHSQTLPLHNYPKWLIKVTDTFISLLAEQYSTLSFCLHHSFKDLRPIQWFHYHNPELGLFNIDLRYTGILDLKDIQHFENYLSKIRNNRRRDYKKAKKRGLFIKESKDIEILSNLHKLTFKRQNIATTAKEKKLIKDISQAALTHNFGKLFICQMPDKTPVSATLFLFDKNCVYYLIGANHPDFRNTGSSSFLMLENIRYFITKKFKSLDFIGINSPTRGDFKISFNAIPIPYFLIHWKKK